MAANATDTRLPLLDPQSLNPEQKELYDRLGDSLLPWAKEGGFKAEEADGRLLGPFNAILYSPEMGGAQIDYLGKERDATELDAQVREVVILTVGAATGCAYELYAHRAVAAKAGLAPEVIEALASGTEAPGLNPDQRAAQRFVHALATTNRVPPEIFAEAQAAFGHKCLVDMVHLVGLYLGTAAFLNAFEVPVPQG